MSETNSRFEALPKKIQKNNYQPEKVAEKKEPKKVSSDYHLFFSEKFPNSKKCLLRNVVMSKDLDPERGWLPIQNYRDEIESMALDNDLSPAHIKRHLAYWCLKKERELLIDIPKWDGVDHISGALDRIYVTNIEHKYFVELMKEWFSNITRRLFDSSHQNRCVIFRGGQGIGKDYSIKAMTSGFGHYANEIEFGQSKTEVYRIIKGLAIGIIPEFDETHKATLATVKSVITVSSSEMRALYKNDAESVDIHTSFISASNFKYILRDPTGNRRFDIFDCSRMDHTFDEVNGAQIAAQSFQLGADKYQASKKARAAMTKIIEKETPIDTDEYFMSEIRDLVRGKQFARNEYGIEVEYRVEWDDIKVEIDKITQRYKFGVRRAQTMIKSDIIWHKDRDGVHYMMPKKIV